jgi:hypothetical protein
MYIYIYVHAYLEYKIVEAKVQTLSNNEEMIRKQNS